mgnify:CR=1 FL=1
MKTFLDAAIVFGVFAVVWHSIAIFLEMKAHNNWKFNFPFRRKENHDPTAHSHGESHDSHP